MTEKQKTERLKVILANAIGEIYDGAEEWFQPEIYDLIGTSEEELKELGVHI